MTFEYLEPRSIDEAVDRLAEAGDDAIALAGGTAFTLLRKQGLIRPARVVGLGRLTDLKGIEDRDGDLWIGALATHREVERSTVVRSLHPVLADAFARIATVRIRNQATLGGNLAHADPAQDPPPILIALDATVHVAGPHGARRLVPLDSFFEDHFTSVLEPWEVIVGVTVPAARPGTRATYLKFLPRSADDYATVSVAVAVGLDDDGRVGTARIALGGVGSTPIRARTAELALIGEPPTATRLQQAAELVGAAVDPLDDVRGSAAYKREMARVWVGRALTMVTT